MNHILFPLSIGFAGFAGLSALAGIAYAVLCVWMTIDGILRADADYPGTNPNRKIFWVLGMVFVHPVAIAYLIVVYLKVPRTRHVHQTYYTPTAPPAPPVPEAPAS